jgi:UDP-3-O-[3-hydroxymyristoyl] N-acetylglucosamine deacetylase/3-hydroxyacyl-[acyl-carrier-protein] dehydratase
MTDMQRTIKKSVSFSGIGLHTGGQVTITFKPAPINHGITFIRADLSSGSAGENCPEIPADVDHVVDLQRGTTLGMDKIKVHTVEHVLAALAGLQIDNMKIELSNSEPPAGDGSAWPYVQVLLEAGIAEQDAPKNFLEIEHPIAYTEKERGVDIVVVPSDRMRITFMVDYKNPALGTQYTSLVDLDEEFVEEFSKARTFCFLTEVDQLLEAGLIKGGGLESAVVIIDEELTEQQIKRMREAFKEDRPIFAGKTGILNDTPLRYYNEPVRHKALDLLGDLFLIGVPLKAHILAARSGHAANVALARKIRSIYQKQMISNKYSAKKTSGEYLLDINAILKIMPHRYPFLMIDRVLDMEGKTKIVAIKNVTINEPYFQGHFPGKPVMPGVMIIEAMAQTGGLLLLNTVDDPENKLAFFMGIDEVKFRKPVVPGDQLRMEVEMLNLKKSLVKIAGKSYVDGKLVAEGIFTAVVVDKNS